jgi:hypothetical protein
MFHKCKSKVLNNTNEVLHNINEVYYELYASNDVLHMRTRLICVHAGTLTHACMLHAELPQPTKRCPRHANMLHAELVNCMHQTMPYACMQASGVGCMTSFDVWCLGSTMSYTPNPAYPACIPGSGFGFKLLRVQNLGFGV